MVFLAFSRILSIFVGKFWKTGDGSDLFLGGEALAPADREGKVRHVLQRIRDFFQKYFEIAGGKF